MPRGSPLNQRVVKLAPLQPLLVVGPGRGGHAAVGVQEDAEAAHQEEDEEEQQEAYEGQGRLLLRVARQRWRGGGPGERGARGQHLVVQRGDIAHPPRGPAAELTDRLDGGVRRQVGQV